MLPFHNKEILANNTFWKSWILNVFTLYLNFIISLQVQQISNLQFPRKKIRGDYTKLTENTCFIHLNYSRKKYIILKIKQNYGKCTCIWRSSFCDTQGMQISQTLKSFCFNLWYACKMLNNNNKIVTDFSHTCAPISALGKPGQEGQEGGGVSRKGLVTKKKELF